VCGSYEGFPTSFERTIHPCGTQVTGFGNKHVTGFGTTALMAVPPVTVGSQNDKSA